MTGTEVLSKIASQRKERCESILARPEIVMICESCQSMVYREANLCPFCKGYRFDADRDAVLAMARLLGDRPLSLGVPVLPRFTNPQALSFA